MIPTPDLSHFTSKDYEQIYEPAEDTFILLDALEKDSDILQKANPTVVLEIGSGSGCVTAFISAILGKSLLYLCTDINSAACQGTRRTGKQNNVVIDSVNTHFANPLRSRLAKAVDVILFNPPYVPTHSEEAVNAQESRGLPGSWAGGQTGMEVTNNFLHEVESYLSPKGLFYLVAVKGNNIPSIRRLTAEHGLECEVALQRRAGIEHLSVLRFCRPDSEERKR